MCVKEMQQLKLIVYVTRKNEQEKILELFLCFDEEIV